MFIWCLCYADASFTLSNVLSAVRAVLGVETLGGVLEVPDTKREEARQQSASDEERREELVRYFLHTHPNASWEWLGGQLQWWEGEDVALQNVKMHIKPNEFKGDESCSKVFYLRSVARRLLESRVGKFIITALIKISNFQS